jgi:predicted AAA+ superfamily ATPase
MLQQLTLQQQKMKTDILELFQEVAERAKETDKQIRETNRQTSLLLSEKIQEANRQTSLLLSEKMQETDKILSKKMQETDQTLSKKFQETSQLIKESSIKADKYLGKIKEFDRNWGKLVEALVAPGMVEQFKKLNLDIDGKTQRVEKSKKGKNIEIDILLTNSELIIPVEVKTTLNVEAVDEHIEKHLIPFKSFFPEYKDKTIYGAVAYIHVEENADRYAYKKGLYVLTFGENDMVVIKNDLKFIPVEVNIL